MGVKIKKSSALSSLNITPLIDVVFLLLIFFLVATRFAEEERELAVQLPDASEAKPLTAKPRELFINIDRGGKYFVSGNTYTLEELHPILEAAYFNNPGRASVVIRADRRCQYQFVIAAKNACLKAKIRDVRETTRETKARREN